MAELVKQHEQREMSEVKSPDAENYKDIKPQGNMTPEEARGFWDDCFENGEPDEAEDVEVTGGSYKDVFKPGDSKHEVHHMPATSASFLEFKDGPTIKMDKEDHKQTAGWGNSKEARAYCAEQKELISQGKFRDAVQMDIDDIHSKFGDKYDSAISQMLTYVDKLEQEGKING